MVANQAINAADDDSNNLNAKWKTNPFQVGLNVPDFIDSDVESEFVLSNDVPLKPLCDIKHPTLRVNARSSYGQSTQQSASVPALSTWAKQESSPPIKRAHRTWQEISSEINRFAADNMKNAGWDDLWIQKNNLALSTTRLPNKCAPESSYLKQLTLTVNDNGSRSRSRLHTALNQSQRSPRESVPTLSTWTKQESSPPTKRAHRTWQEISSEINRFAADNMKNAGWEDLWANKNKSQDRQQVDETDLAYLSSRTLHDICKAETVFRDSLLSQQKLQAWDKMMGLKRSHSRTMTKSSVTRKKMIHILRELKMMRERDEEREGKS